MGSTYVVKSGDTFYGIFIEAKKQDKELRYATFKKANSKIEDYSKLKVGDVVNIPSSKKESGATTAEPKEGKCGNQFTFNPRGRNANSMQVSFSVNGKSSPSLEAEKTFVLEKEKIEESQQGSLDMTCDGNKISLIKDLSVFKDKITTHKDIRGELTVVDKGLLKAAINKELLNNIIKEKDATFVKLPTFRSPDQHATMTQNEYLRSRKIFMEKDTSSVLDYLMGVETQQKVAVIIEAKAIRESTLTQNTPYTIDNLDIVQQKQILYEVLNSFKFDGLILPTTLAMRDMATGEEKAIIKDIINGIKGKGWNGKFFIKKSKSGNWLLVFKGWPNARKYLNFTTIKATNVKVTALGMAARASKGSIKAVGEAANVFKSNPIGLLIVGTFDVAEWLSSDDPFNNWSDLFVALGIDLIKSIIGAGIGMAITGLLVAGLGLAAVGVGAVLLAVVVGGIAGAAIVEYIDSSYGDGGFTQEMKDNWNNIENNTSSKISTPSSGSVFSMGGV